MTRRPILAARFREHVAEQAGYILMHLLAAGSLADDLDRALWNENDADALAWFCRELPRDIMQTIPARCHRQAQQQSRGQQRAAHEDQAPRSQAIDQPADTAPSSVMNSRRLMSPSSTSGPPHAAQT